MAWIEVRAKQYETPYPDPVIGVVYTNGYYQAAQAIPGGTKQIGGYHIDYPKIETFRTKRIQSLTVSVTWYIEAFAEGYDPATGWESSAYNETRFTFKVNDRQFFSIDRSVRSTNQRKVSDGGTTTYTIDNLPDISIFDYDVYLLNCGQNGDQLDPSVQSSLSFKITDIVYK